MTADDLRALSAAATPGPWERCDGGSNCGDAVYGDDHCATHGRRNPLLSMFWKHGGEEVWPPADAPDPYRNPNFSDADLIVWLRNHADALAGLIDAAEAAYQATGGNAVHVALVRLGDALAALDADA